MPFSISKPTLICSRSHGQADRGPERCREEEIEEAVLTGAQKLVNPGTPFSTTNVASLGSNR